MNFSQGVPLRLEIGASELSEGSVVLSVRDSADKKKLAMKDLASSIPNELKALHERMLGKVLSLSFTFQSTFWFLNRLNRTQVSFLSFLSTLLPM